MTHLELLAARKEAIEHEIIQQNEAISTEGDKLSAQQDDTVEEAVPPRRYRPAVRSTYLPQWI
jgi:capsule polysaccharide export protein KpsE/RkpR